MPHRGMGGWGGEGSGAVTQGTAVGLGAPGMGVAATTQALLALRPHQCGKQ